MAENQTGRTGWVRGEDGAWRRETQHHMGRRLPGFDYGQRRIYEITIVLAERRPILGQLEAQGDRWVVKPTALGQVVWNCWHEIPQRWAQVELIEGCLMPDHFHGILFVKEHLPKGHTLGSIIGGFKAGCTIGWRALAGENSPAYGRGHDCSPAYGRGPDNSPAYGRGHDLRCAPAAKAAGLPRWAEGYVDVILFSRGQLARMIAYLRDNPRRLAVKHENPTLFRVLRALRVNFTSPAVAPWCGEPHGQFSAIGNHFLLSCADIRQVQCSRRFFAYARDTRGKLLKDAQPAIRTREFDARLDAALAAACDGAVIVSPCISQGEREIARQVFAAGGRVITLSNKGFSPVYKPGGRLFESCAAGHLLMLAPIAWPYQPAEKPMSRQDALVLNRIAQLVAGEGAVDIDYKGMVLRDVDSFVGQAVSAIG